MKLTGYILEKYNNMSDAYTCRRLVEEAADRDIDLEIIGVHDTCIRDGDIFNCGRKLEKRDFVINRYKWGVLKDSVNSLCEKSYNDLAAFNIFINKYEQLKRLDSKAFLKPSYILSDAGISFEYLSSKLGMTIVAKGLENSMGREIFLLQNEEDLKSLLNEYGQEKEWLFEEFISTSEGRDIRFYSIRGEAVAAMIRTSNTDFRANVALGASVEGFEVTDEMKLIAKDIYKQTGLDFVGIDLLFGEAKPYFCEINVMPGIEGMESATGVNVAGLIIDTIKGDFR